MRYFPIFLVLVLAACGGNGDGVTVSPEPVQHAPQISNLTLSPDNALYMEGDGSVQVTAEFAFTDLGRDLETLQVEMSDGTSLVISIPDSVNTASGTLAQDINVTTADANGCTVEIWLVDSAGQSSNHLSAAFSVIPHTPEISHVTLSTNSVLHMDGGGSVVVSADVAYRDIGRDIQTLWVRMPDGKTIEFDESVAAETGTFTEGLTMSTAVSGTFTVEFWLVDEAGQSSNHLSANFSVLPHPPEILDVTLSTNSFLHMDGGGSAVITAEVTYRDIGRDVKSLWVRMPDGTSSQFDQSIVTETGTFTEDFIISTETIGTFAVEFWLVDKAGQSSDHVTAQFVVVGDSQSSDWTRRVSGLPYALNDVIWDGSVFIAVGNRGAILTSDDGVDWITRDSGIDVELNSVSAYGSEIFAVGNETVLLSTDNGANWSTKEKYFYATNLTAVIVTSSQVVVSGFSYGLAAGITSVSEDRGDTWQFADFGYAADLIHRNELYVGVLVPYFGFDRSWVTVSSDGESWNQIVIREGGPGLSTVIHDGSQFIVAGDDGAAFASLDGFNWTQLQTPVTGVNYLSSAWNGSKLVLAGGSDSPSERPMGIASTDDGVNWAIFNIDGNYESRGMAFGSGRFVSVGQSAPDSGVGAIYTAD